MSGVRVLIAAPLLAGMLRLPAHIEVIGADAEYDPDGSLRAIGVDLDVPDAPAGAATMEPVYTRASGWPDPVTLTGIRWLDADGREVTP